MARIRSLKPEIWMSPQVMNLSHSARLLFIGLITQADDHGRGTADVRKLKAAVFGGDDITSADVRRWLDECVAQLLLIVYGDESHGDLYALPSWKAHQSIDRPRASGYPEPPKPDTEQRTIVEDSSNTRRGSEGGKELGRTGRKERTSRARAQSPPHPDGTPGDASDACAPDGLMDAYADLLAVYPKRAMPHGLLDEREYQLRISDGVAHADMVAGAQRFAAFVEAGGVSAPQYVMAVRNFLSLPNRHWSQPWEPPTSGNALDGTIAAGQEFLRGGK